MSNTKARTRLQPVQFGFESGSGPHEFFRLEKILSHDDTVRVQAGTEVC